MLKYSIFEFFSIFELRASIFSFVYTFPMRCLLVGNYGTANLGDEALRDYFTQTFSDIEWTVLSAAPKADNELPRLPGGMRSLCTTPWWKTLQAIKRSDAGVFGGGSLFTDVESVYACYLWFFHALVARFFRRPVILAFQGMGPYKTRTGEWCARWAARHSAFLSVRDGASKSRMDSWGLSSKCIQTGDPVFLFMRKQKSNYRSQNVFTVIPRHNSSSMLLEEAQKYASEHHDIQSVHIVLMQPNDDGEKNIAERLVAGLPSAVVRSAETLNDLMREVGESSFVLTQRFHGALAALAVATPLKILPQGAGDKMSELVRFTGDHPDDVSELEKNAQYGEHALREAFLKLAK